MVISQLTNIDSFTKLDDDGRHEEDGCHIVEDGRHDGRDQAENSEKRPNPSFGYFKGPQAHPVEDSSFGEYWDNYHHTEEQSPMWKFSISVHEKWKIHQKTYFILKSTTLAKKLGRNTGYIYKVSMSSQEIMLTSDGLSLRVANTAIEVVAESMAITVRLAISKLMQTYMTTRIIPPYRTPLSTRSET